MVNAEEIFEISMALIDSMDAEGRADILDNMEYRGRCLPILNALVAELYPYSQNFISSAQSRPAAPELMSFSDAAALDDSISRGVLPYGLAAALLISEDPDSAAVLQGRYESLKAGLRRGVRAASEDISDVYGGMGGFDFGHW